MTTSPLGMAYRPLFYHLENCPVCTTTPTMCATAIKLKYACRLVELSLNKPIPPIKVPS